MPPRFGWWTNDGGWVPLATSLRADATVFPILRLRPGVSRQAAEEQYRALENQLARQFPARFPKNGFRASLINYMDITVASGEMRSSLQLLFGAVAFLLLIACANVANLQMTGATARAREIALLMSVALPCAAAGRQAEPVLPFPPRPRPRRGGRRPCVLRLPAGRSRRAPGGAETMPARGRMAKSPPGANCRPPRRTSRAVSSRCAVAGPANAGRERPSARRRPVCWCDSNLGERLLGLLRLLAGRPRRALGGAHDDAGPGGAGRSRAWVQYAVGGGHATAGRVVGPSTRRCAGA